MQEHRNRRAQESGFTLSELLLTVVLIGVLTGIAIVGVNGVTGKSATSACEVTMEHAQAAAAAYYANWHIYPQSFSALTNPPASKPLLEATATITEAATTLRGNGGWTLRLIPGTTTTDQTSFQC
jgi:prepilin-type N-terminal cleavage/methylation domain-containing protein